ncbi:MAG: transglutaminase TgpA family protein [Panacagrimonas sp.]
MNDYLPHRSLLRLLAVLSLVIAPHLLRVPAWEVAAVAALVSWRGLASSRQWSLPPRVLKLALVLIASLAVYVEYGRVSGQHAGTALLVLLAALKLTEMRSRRDVMMVMFLMYFLLATHFLFSQELWTIAYLLACATLITAVLIDAHHPHEPLPMRVCLRLGAGMIAQALPLMLLFFVLFPRIPGPLWGLPNDSGPVRSGLSDSMSPGDIAQLIQNPEVAFRVRFDEAPPPPERLYWRGPVFREFNGRSWNLGPEDLSDRTTPSVELAPGRTRYELTLEPMRSRWLFALDMPDPRQLPDRARIDRSGSLVLDKPITERQRVRGVSATRYRLDAALAAPDRARDIHIPSGSNPRTVELAQRWRDNSMDDATIVDTALRLFREQPFVYTLEPPPLGRHAVDEFLFDTRRGFCEHYASAFTTLMRAAGVPARVVTGYQGMEANAVGDYYLVRQSDAHAWTEVWLPDRGWMRVDPTAAVAPERIERGLRLSLTPAQGLPAFFADYGNWRWQVEARWDWINARWNEWVLGYGPEIQRSFLSRFGLAEVQNMILALTAGASLVLAVVGMAALRASAAPRVTEVAQLLWKEAARRLARLGFVQRADEGPRDFLHRVMRREPGMSAPLRQILDAYLRLRYAGEQDATLERDMSAAVKRIKRP